jgi:hypothetical protein
MIFRISPNPDIDYSSPLFTPSMPVSAAVNIANFYGRQIEVVGKSTHLFQMVKTQLKSVKLDSPLRSSIDKIFEANQVYDNGISDPKAWSRLSDLVIQDMWIQFLETDSFESSDGHLTKDQLLQTQITRLLFKELTFFSFKNLTMNNLFIPINGREIVDDVERERSEITTLIGDTTIEKFVAFMKTNFK